MTTPAIAISDLIQVENGIVRSKLQAVIPENDSVPRAVLRALSQNADKQVMIDAASGRTWTGSSLSAAIRQAIHVWDRVIGLVKGETVAFFCPNSDWHAIHLLSVSARAGIYTAGNDSYKYAEFRNVVRDSGAAYIVASAASLENALLIQQELKQRVKRVLLLDLRQHQSPFSPSSENKDPPNDAHDCHDARYDSLYSLIQKAVDNEDVAEESAEADPSLRAHEDVFSIFFTSGTTGGPKAATRSHAAVLSVRGLRSPGLDVIPECESGHVVSCHSHFAHVGGMSMLMLSLMSGVTACIIDTLTGPKFLAAVDEYRVTTFFLVPSYLIRIIRYVDQDDNVSAVSHLNLSSLTDVLIAGEFLPKEQSLQFLRLFPQVKRFRQSFGSTELGFATIVPSDMANESKVLSSGIPAPGFSVRISPTIPDQDPGSAIGTNLLIRRQGNEEETNAAQRNHAVGEICVKGPQMMIGYLNNPGANADAFDEDGFFRTGDGGFIDEDGFLFVTDRFKEIIKCDGCQVSPTELESILLTHPSVREAAVIGIPHPVHGHVPKAFVVLRTPSSLPDACPLSSSSLSDGTAGCEDKADDRAKKPQTWGKEAVTSTMTSATAVSQSSALKAGDLSYDNPDIVNELMDTVSTHVSSLKQIRGGIRVLSSFQRTIIGKIDRKFLRNHFSYLEDGTR